MPWARLDDSFDGHPKVRRMSLAARGLFAYAIAHCARFMTDGFVDEEWMTTAGKPRERKRALAELEEIGLLERVAGGWAVHDYLHYNPSRKQLETDRKRDREKKARQRAARRQQALPWSDAAVSPGVSPQGDTGMGRRNTYSDNGERPESHARPAVAALPAVVEELVTLFASFGFDIAEVEVENTLARFPSIPDPVPVARDCVGWLTHHRDVPAGRGFHRFMATELERKPRQSLGRSRQEREDADFAALTGGMERAS